MRNRYGTPHCNECEALLRALRDAHELDRQALTKRVVDTAETSGREIGEIGLAWVLSIAQMPNDETRTMMRLHYRRTMEVRRQIVEHETETGHSVYGYGWESLYGLHGHLASKQPSDLPSSLLL